MLGFQVDGVKKQEFQAGFQNLLGWVFFMYQDQHIFKNKEGVFWIKLFALLLLAGALVQFCLSQSLHNLIIIILSLILLLVAILLKLEIKITDTDILIISPLYKRNIGLHNISEIHVYKGDRTAYITLTNGNSINLGLISMKNQIKNLSQIKFLSRLKKKGLTMG